MNLPYEVRFNHLMFAKEYLIHEYQSQIERITLSYPNLDDPGMKEAIDKLKYPSRDDIFIFAKQIQDFVNKE